MWHVESGLIGCVYSVFNTGGPSVSVCYLHDILSSGSWYVGVQLFCWCLTTILRVPTRWGEWEDRLGFSPACINIIQVYVGS